MEDEPLLGVEDGDGGRQLVEGAHMRLHLPLHVGAHGLELGDVEGDAGAAAGRGALGNVENAAGAGDDGGDAGLHGQAVRAKPLQVALASPGPEARRHAP